MSRVCALSDLGVERGVGAVVDGVQIALFRLHDDSVLAVQLRDPFSEANVISRGNVGDHAGVPTVASPIWKETWELTTGACIDAVGKDPIDLRTYPVRVECGDVFVEVP